MLSLAAVLWLAPFAVSEPAVQNGEVQLTTRLFAPDGKALARESVSCSLRATIASGERTLGGSETTDAEGRMSWSSEGELFRQGPVTLELLVERPGGDAFHVTRVLPGPVDGMLDLGETTLQRAPVLVFGRVLDPDGQPAANECVEYSGISTWEEQGGMPAGAARRHGGRLMTDAQGRFALRGLDRGVQHCSTREVRACSLIFPRTRWHPFGGSGTEVVLQFAAPDFVRGRLVLPEGVDPRACRIDASYQGELPLLGDSCTAARPERDGSFEFCLAAEPCSLALWIDPRDHSLGLGNPPDLVLEVAPDKRKVKWDLRDTLHAYELVVLTPDGRPAGSPNLFYSSGGKPQFHPFSGQHGPPVHRILSLDRPLTVRVEEEGFRAASITLDGPTGELKLSPGIAVNVAITNLPDLGEGGFLGLELLRDDGVNPKARGSVARHGHGQVVAPEAGTYAVFLQYNRRMGSMIWSGATSWGIELQALEVADRESQTFELTLPESLVEVFRREAEQRR